MCLLINNYFLLDIRILFMERRDIMNYLADFIIQQKKKIIVIFTLLSLFGIILYLSTPINYNMMDYLPQKANSTIALEKMEENFDQPIPNLNIMVEDVSIVEASQIKKQLQDIDYISEVLWLDDTIDLKTPLEIQDSSLVKTYYKDECALYMAACQDGKEREAISAIKEILGSQCKISGIAADQAEATESATSESIMAIMLLGPIIIIILILVTESWIEPLFYLLTLVDSILINLGSSYFLGEMSFVTLAAAPILQLAVSLDYVIFLSHSFNHYKEQGLPPTEAMKKALKQSSQSISASMLTTLFGFLALMFMQFQIGADMGLNLVKGVLSSFICVMVLLPSLLLCGTKLIDKTKHRRFIPQFKTIGHKIIKVYIPMSIILIALIIPAFLGQNKNSFFYGTVEGTPVDSDAYVIEQKFGIYNPMVLLVPVGDVVKENQLCQELKDIEYVTSVISYSETVSHFIPTGFLDESIIEQFYSKDYARIILTANCPYEGQDTFEMVENIRNAANHYYDEYYTCGQSANMYDMKDCVTADNKTVNLITVISIYLVLLVMTRNWFMPLLLIFAIQCSIWVNMSIPYFTGSALSYLCYLIVSTIQMGATVDYAILLTDTYQNNRLQKEKIPAMKDTLGDAFHSIIVSALTLTLAGFCLAWSSSNEIIAVLGTLVGRGAILSVIMVILLLPALLLYTDKIIPHTGLKRKNKERKQIS